MFIGFSKISIGVIFKHLQHVGIIRVFFVYLGGLIKFFSAWVDIKNYWVVVC